VIEVRILIHLTINKRSDFIPPRISTRKGGRNPIKEIQINLTLRFNIPEEGLNVNGSHELT